MAKLKILSLHCQKQSPKMKKILTLLVFMALTAFVTAQPAHFITFNGTDQYMRIPHHSDFNIAVDQLIDLSGHGYNGEMVNFAFGGAEILNVTLTQDTQKTGRGNANDLILKAAAHLLMRPGFLAV